MPSRIYRNPWPPRITLLVFLALFISGWWWEHNYLPAPGLVYTPGKLSPGEYVVARVVDGDTIVLEQDNLKVRLQGIDTPETVKDNSPVEPWGPEASTFTQQFIESANWRVRIQIDGEPVDRYGRHLAFVWHEGKLLNEELVLAGLARAKTSFDFSEPMKNRLRQAQMAAQIANRGIWSE